MRHAILLSLLLCGCYDFSPYQTVPAPTCAPSAAGADFAFSPVPGVALTSPRSGHAVVVIDDVVYVLGGEEPMVTATIDRATFGADGTLGAFTRAASSLRGPRAGHTAVVVRNRYLYVLGGYDDTGQLVEHIERAAIGAGGELGTFEDAGLVLRQARRRHVSALVGDALYVIAGEGAGPMMLGSIERLTVDGLGNLTPPTFSTRTVRPAAYTLAQIPHHVYLMGGYDGSPIPEIVSASTDDPGDLGAFAPVPGLELMPARDSAGIAIDDGWLYAAGGNDDGLDIAEVERARITDAGLEPFQRAGQRLSQARGSLHLVSRCGVLHGIGGAVSDTIVLRPVALVDRARVR